MRFIDLFSGIGGFHKGLLNAGGFECVFASEINTALQDLYYKNFGIQPKGDIRKIHEADIPKHDILCAGFPCQPFSLAGKKTGYKCPSSGKLIKANFGQGQTNFFYKCSGSGKLIKDILRITKHHLPDFIIQEGL